jgi:hypothetical protein
MAQRRRREKAFVEAQGAAWTYKDLLAAEGPVSARAKASWAKIEGCGAIIRAAVGLPPIATIAAVDDRIRAEQAG